MVTRRMHSNGLGANQGTPDPYSGMSLKCRFVHPRRELIKAGRECWQGVTMLRCSFCNKTEDQVSKLVAGPQVYICDECVAIASRLIQGRWSFFRRLRKCLRFLGTSRFDSLPAR